MIVGRQVLCALAAVAAAAAYAVPAQACRGVFAENHLLHASLAEESAEFGAFDDFAAEVVIEGDLATAMTIEARVTKVLRGEFAGAKVRIAPTAISSCDRFPPVGGTGILIGRVVAKSPEGWVVDPLRAPSPMQRERGMAGFVLSGGNGE